MKKIKLSLLAVVLFGVASGCEAPEDLAALKVRNETGEVVVGLYLYGPEDTDNVLQTPLADGEERSVLEGADGVTPGRYDWRIEYDPSTSIKAEDVSKTKVRLWPGRNSLILWVTL